MKRYTSCGKQVLDRGQHYADAVTTDAAETIAEALNGFTQTMRRPPPTFADIVPFLRPLWR